MAAPADLILLKLMAWRGKDRVDVHNILTVQGIPDETRLRNKAGRLRLLERLEEAIARWREDDPTGGG